MHQHFSSSQWLRACSVITPTWHIEESGHRRGDQHTRGRLWTQAVRSQSPYTPQWCSLGPSLDGWGRGFSNLSIWEAPGGLVGTHPQSFWFNRLGWGWGKNPHFEQLCGWCCWFGGYALRAAGWLDLRHWVRITKNQSESQIHHLVAVWLKPTELQVSYLFSTV